MTFIPIYILILFLLILVDYFAGIFIEKSQGSAKKAYLLLSIFTTCAILFIFKYFNFFNANLSQLFQFIGWNYSIQSLSLLLPIGLSFHTFQSLSYVIEVYRGKQKAERNLGIYALYVMFYPQLVAGPIERPQNLLHQFYKEHKFDYYEATKGLRLMLWGFFKKVVIADRLATVVKTVYANPTDFTGTSLILATTFFTFQIYCDFSGYTDIARGAAQVMGFKLMENFRRPYFSKSISEFWKRWHISLSSWFRDYLYISLGGNRVSIPRWYFNIFITFIVSGLWHGANWTFIIWGALHGFYLIFSYITKNLRVKITKMVGLNKFSKIHMLIQMLITFILVDISFIFFRADTVSDALYIITHLFIGLKVFGTGIAKGIGIDGIIISLLCILLMESIHLFQEYTNITRFLSDRSIMLRWSTYLVIILLIMLFGVFQEIPFIYFQF